MKFTALRVPEAIRCRPSIRHFPLVVLNVSTANTTNTAVLQQSMHQASVLPNYLVMLMGPLLQHTDSTYTFEDTEHFRLSLLLFCQQVATEERSSSK